MAAADTSSDGGQRSSILTPILGAMLGDGPIRMITLGQELTVDVDEKTLAEMQFKELQVRPQLIVHAITLSKLFWENP